MSLATSINSPAEAGAGQQEIFFPSKGVSPLNMLISPSLVLVGLPAHYTVAATFEMRPTNPSTVEEAEDSQRFTLLLSTSHICAG